MLVKKSISILLGTLILSGTFILSEKFSIQVTATPQIPTDIHFRLGKEEVNEPFNFFQDGSFGILKKNGIIYTLPPVNNVDTCDQFVWSGTDIDNLYPTTAMNGLTPNSHYDRQRIYDAYGWWPFNLWADNNGKWYSYMHTEDSVQIETGNTGHGSDLRTIALWTSTDEGANWSYQGVSVSIDDQYAVPGNLQSTWPKNGGAGDHKLIVSPDRQYLYLLYTNFTYDNPAVNSNYVAGNMAVARASLDSNGVPGPFYKYYNGSFSQPGVGGHETWVMGPSTAHATDNSQRCVMWNTYLQKYVMISANRIHNLNISYSDDLINWSMPQHFLQEDSGEPILYANMISLDSDDQCGGKSVWVYYVTDGYEVRRRLLTFEKSENIAFQKTVTVSYQNPSSSYNASNLTDGQKNTGYRSALSKTSYGNVTMQIDLGTVKSFNTIWLTPARNGAGFPIDFAISCYNAQTGGWDTLGSYSGYSQPLYEETQTFQFSTQSSRYIKISCSEYFPIDNSANPFAMQLNEIKVFQCTDTTPQNGEPTYIASARVYNASADFSSVQGTQHWSYMRQGDLNVGLPYYWSPMTFNTQMNAWGRSGLYNYVGDNWMHPHSNLSTARIWKAPADGMIHITGNIRKKDISGGNGVKVRIQVNRNRVWPENAEWQSIAYNDSTGQNIDITIPVKANQKVFFIVDADGDASYDSTYWNPTIDYRPVTQTHHSNTEFNTSNTRWSYYAATSSGYQSMLWNGTDQKWQINGTYCFVNDTLMHPDAGYDSVRAWKAPSSGTISISNIIRKFDVNGGDGVNLKIMKGSTQLWPASGWQPLLYNNATGYNFQVSTTVNTNDMIYFIVNRGQDTSYDSTYWKADIHYAP